LPIVTGATTAKGALVLRFIEEEAEAEEGLATANTGACSTFADCAKLIGDGTIDLFLQWTLSDLLLRLQRILLMMKCHYGCNADNN
jgi:hypothetical protein